MSTSTKKRISDALWSLAAVAIVAVLAWSIWLGGPAAGFPTGQTPHVTCTSMSIDPPRASWVTVSYSGTINGRAYSTRAVAYDSARHEARASTAALIGSGTVHVTSTAHSRFLGTSPTTTTTLHCGGGLLSSLPFTGGLVGALIESALVLLIVGAVLRMLPRYPRGSR